MVNNNDNLDGNHNLDDEPMDEITLLNEFFHSKWKRLSFIYNYLRNDLSYTQQSAYLRYLFISISVFLCFREYF